jgi:hypothetical protein
MYRYARNLGILVKIYDFIQARFCNVFIKFNTIALVASLLVASLFVKIYDFTQARFCNVFHKI